MKTISIVVKELVWYRARQEHHIFTNYNKDFFDNNNEIYDLMTGLAHLIEIKTRKSYG